MLGQTVPVSNPKIRNSQFTIPAILIDVHSPQSVRSEVRPPGTSKRHTIKMATADTTPASPASSTATATPLPKRITNAQTICNDKNEKVKICNGHLKQLRTAAEPAEIHLRGDDVLFKCQTCGTLYMGPPLGHVRDPDKQSRFVEAELTALLQAAGGTLPVIKKDDRGVYVMVETAGDHGHAAKPAAPPAAATPP